MVKNDENRKTTFPDIIRFAAILLCLILAASVMLPMSAYAQNEPQTVRVGWYESPFKYRCFALSKPSGSGNLARPKRTPRFFAASIPSACL